jgi:hypothetical protein
VNEESDDDFGDPATNNWRLRHITETTILTVQLIVEFSKRLPGFQSLCREDQITLLKACSSEVGPSPPLSTPLHPYSPLSTPLHPSVNLSTPLHPTPPHTTHTHPTPTT